MNDDHRGSCRRVTQHVLGKHPHGPPAIATQDCIALKVLSRPITHVVRDAINLDQQSYLDAGEIRDETRYWKLTAEPQASRLATQMSPEQHFRKRHLSA